MDCVYQLQLPCTFCDTSAMQLINYRQTVYFFPLRLSSTVSVPRPPPGAGLMSSSEEVLLRSMEAVEISCRDRTASLVDAGLSDIRYVKSTCEIFYSIARCS